MTKIRLLFVFKILGKNIKRENIVTVNLGMLKKVPVKVGTIKQKKVKTQYEGRILLYP